MAVRTSWSTNYVNKDDHRRNPQTLEKTCALETQNTCPNTWSSVNQMRDPLSCQPLRSEGLWSPTAQGCGHHRSGHMTTTHPMTDLTFQCVVCCLVWSKPSAFMSGLGSAHQHDKVYSWLSKSPFNIEISTLLSGNLLDGELGIPVALCNLLQSVISKESTDHTLIYCGRAKRCLWTEFFNHISQMYIVQPFFCWWFLRN